MINLMQLRLYGVLVLGVFIPTIHASIISISGPDSILGKAAAIIAAPENVLDDGVINAGMQGFDEAQGVITAMDYRMDGGVTLLSGTAVNSHMIFLNSDGFTLLRHFNVLWQFDSEILGVMSDSGGRYEAASTGELGNPLTNYSATFPGSGPAASFRARGLEGRDEYRLFDSFTLEVDMIVTEPGDWIRVITRATIIPEPSSLVLMSIGLIGLGFSSRETLAQVEHLNGFVP